MSGREGALIEGFLGFVLVVLFSLVMSWDQLSNLYLVLGSVVGNPLGGYFGGYFLCPVCQSIVVALGASRGLLSLCPNDEHL